MVELGAGTANFVSQFKPHALGRQTAKALILSDNEYSTPDDHYFGFINKRQGVTTAEEKENELKIMKGLGLDLYLPPTFNVETGKFDEPKLIDENGNVVNEDEMDIFELARLRGVSVRKLTELNTEADSINNNQQIQKHFTGQKHTKKDYDRLKVLQINEIVNKTKEERVARKYSDESLGGEGIVKVEKKKAFKKKKQT